MVSLPDKLKPCGVKLKVVVSGVPVFGSGIVYVTPDAYAYDYVLSAKHLFQEDSQTPYDSKKISSAEVQYSELDVFRRLVEYKRDEIKDKLIVYDADFVILIIPKRVDLFFPSILVSDKLGEVEHFFCWGTFVANSSSLHRFDFKRSDAQIRRFRTVNAFDARYLPGLSGAGIFSSESAILVGIVSNYPNEDFQNHTIDCSRISVEEINEKLIFNDKVPLDVDGSSKKKIIDNEVVYIHQATINGAVLDLELARKRLERDVLDDWFYDPLQYIDLFQPAYLFKQFSAYFGKNVYVPSEAENFYVPKKEYTLRQAMVSPFIDRIVYMACVSALADKMDKAMIASVYSARFDRYSDSFLILKGVEQWKKMQYQLQDTALQKDSDGENLYDCVIEIDLLNFYDNIDKHLLYEKLLRICESVNDKMVADLLYVIIKGFSPRKSYGLPQNSDASSLLASFYLNQVDIFMDHHCPAYYRFMDDIRIFCYDKYHARKILQTLDYELRRCHLSMNSQKTKILTLTTDSECTMEQKNRNNFDGGFDLMLNQVALYRHSQNSIFKNEAFHMSIHLLENALSATDPIAPDESKDMASKKINFAMNTLAHLSRKGIALVTDDSRLEKAMINSAELLKDRPWITPQICNVLNLVTTESFISNYLPVASEILLDDKYNTYSFQTYLLWLLLAKHKAKTHDLLQYAVRQIEKNDETNRPAIAGMLIYVCSVDLEYRRVVIRKLEEKFTHGYFQNRIAMITLRKFSSDVLHRIFIHNSLREAHEFTHKFKDRDLVYIAGFLEGEDNNEDAIEEQLYSLT